MPVEVVVGGEVSTMLLTVFPRASGQPYMEHLSVQPSLTTTVVPAAALSFSLLCSVFAAVSTLQQVRSEGSEWTKQPPASKQIARMAAWVALHLLCFT